MLSLYLHIPFCVRKCHYCGFYSTIYSRKGADEYVVAVGTESAGYQEAFHKRIFDTVYVGGGTPTALSHEQLEKLTGIIKHNFKISPDAEWTIEANPNTVTGSALEKLRACGVNRLSLGIQSFNDNILKTLGRIHSAQEAVDSFRLARSAGYANISIDLIYGIPGQTEAHWIDTLETAITLRPEHVSVYSLSLDEGSRFKNESEAGRFALPDDELVAAAYEKAVSRLGQAGYERYEISNFSLPGFSCRHNMNYWSRGEYLGLGPAAWSFIMGRRYRAVADVRDYAARLRTGRTVIEEEETVGPRQAAEETVMLGLRTSRGIELTRYEQEFGADLFQRLETNAAPLKQAGLIEEYEARLRLSKSGFLLADQVLARLFL